MRIKTWMIGFVLLFLSAARVMPQDQTSWKLVSAQSLQDLVGPDYQPRSSVLSPDGSAVAWWDINLNQICVYFFADTKTTCYEQAQEMARWGHYSYPTWSPDGRFIAYNESFFDLFIESDIWVLDVQSGQITDKTDDQAYGNILKPDKAHPALIDYLPTWNPTNGDLYFFRSIHTDTWSTALYRLTASQAQPELVVDLSLSMPVLSIFRRVAISPDGTRMAVPVLGQDPQDEKNGVYVIDLKTGDFKKVATLSDLQAGLPAWAKAKSQLNPDTVSWVGQNALILSMSDLQFAQPTIPNTIYIDLTSKTVTPMVDFSQVTDDVEFVKGPDSPALRVIQAGVPSPDGSTFWALRADAQFANTNIASLPLPPTTAEATRLGDVPDFKPASSTTRETFTSSDGKALMLGWLFTFAKTSSK